MDLIRRNLHVVTNSGSRSRRRRISLTAVEFILQTDCSHLNSHQMHLEDDVVAVAVVRVGSDSELQCM